MTHLTPKQDLGSDVIMSPSDAGDVFIDGLHFTEHVVLVALGVDEAGTKHVLGVWEGATENGPACRAMLNDLVTRGLDANISRLFVIDWNPALALRDTRRLRPARDLSVS
jgi:hypothetical protein